MAFADEIFDPSAEINPFSTDFIKHRNHLVYRMLSDNGMRRSELRFVKVEDVNYANKRVRIRVSKTQARTVPISSAGCARLHHFVLQHWSKIPARQRAHGYLFTTAEGAPHLRGHDQSHLQDGQEEATSCLKTLPHALRRTWNDRFSTKVDKAPPGPHIQERRGAGKEPPDGVEERLSDECSLLSQNHQSEI